MKLRQIQGTTPLISINITNLNVRETRTPALVKPPPRLTSSCSTWTSASNPSLKMASTESMVSGLVWLVSSCLLVCFFSLIVVHPVALTCGELSRRVVNATDVHDEQAGQVVITHLVSFLLLSSTSVG
jgi:hypothetical protein